MNSLRKKKRNIYTTNLLDICHQISPPHIWRFSDHRICAAMRARFGLDQVAWESKAGLAALSNFDFRAVSVAATYRFLLAVSALSLSRSLFFFSFLFHCFLRQERGRETSRRGEREGARRREGSGLPACGREVVFSLLFLSLFFLWLHCFLRREREPSRWRETASSSARESWLCRRARERCRSPWRFNSPESFFFLISLFSSPIRFRFVS